MCRITTLIGRWGFQHKDMAVENMHIYGFRGEAVRVKSVIQLLLMVGEEPYIYNSDGKFHDCGPGIFS